MVSKPYADALKGQSSPVWTYRPFPSPAQEFGSFFYCRLSCRLTPKHPELARISRFYSTVSC